MDLHSLTITAVYRCNCDDDGGELLWTYDDGELTDRSQLPVIKLNFGNFYQVLMYCTVQYTVHSNAVDYHIKNKHMCIAFNDQYLHFT